MFSKLLVSVQLILQLCCPLDNVAVKFKEIERYKRYGACGPHTTIGYIDEKYVDIALEIAQNNKITCEPSGIAGLAMLFQMEEIIYGSRH